MYQKLKPFIENDLIFHSILLILVAFLAFLLGRWSNTGVLGTAVSPESRVVLIASPIVAIDSTSASTSVVSTTTPAGVQSSQSYVASKSGTKYHLVSCPGAKQIKESNRVYFATKNEAEAAGYTKASNCKGL